MSDVACDVAVRSNRLCRLDRLRHWSSPSVDIDRFGTAPVPSRTLETSLLELWDLFDFAPPG